ncbi:uncharacterized protein UV8b_01691 [Ustilaginoidea virens]|uniref:Uncharacterized protein n=1 Tax=Ustilaginoidea virens TaxID=1159556 RepID=A0A063BT90_USTVR|nr:uncharacterized protein UV8b_01691 [Ustilaginoidea virens]QUC17450.1 hypothetical protein UV8b_01691 [Ustilaginoidea virens]GAO13680.1 hypothetical protein UVI_02017830 [Ustilaginoidea virens]
MWPPTSPVDTLTRPRIAVAVVSVVAAASIGLYAYQSNRHGARVGTPTGPGLHRSNAVRRPRAAAAAAAAAAAEASSSSPSDTPGDENVDVTNLRIPADAETVADVDNGDDWWNGPSDFQPSQRAGHNIVNLLFRVSEDNARRNGCVHRGCQCNSCGMVPIRGVRYRCANCADFDLCETCEAQGVHIKTHVFYKIKVPAPPFGPRQMQPVWYTGDPDTCRRNLPRNLISRLSRDTGFERPELEAFWEQWTYMANTEWRDDPDELCVAMDRKTFERCLVPTGGSRHAAPNLIHDRMFYFYDSNRDDLIGFAEFLQGLSYRKRKDKLRKVFEGYDIDGDGYVNRRDFLRMFRAYYVLYKQMHKDILDGLEDQLLASTEAQQLVSSRQPLSSLFGREGRVPQGDSSSRFEGKTIKRDGTVEVADGYTSAFTESRGDTARREDILASLFAYDTDSRPRRLLARNDADTNWRTVRRVSGFDLDRAYWSALLDPPTTLEEMPHIFNAAQESSDADSEADEEDAEQEEAGEGEGEEDGDEENKEEDMNEDSGLSYSEARARDAARSRRLAPKLERRRRDMARKHLHERWRRRQFYLDEEEGGVAPDDWDDDEDTLAKINRLAEEAKSAEAAPPPLTTRSRSSSKVRFAEDTDDFETRSNPSTSSRSVPERWGGMDIPDAERDAGKEILYQVTQQAFNELLDTIFKKAEDMAVTAAETAEDRQRFRAQIDAATELPDTGVAAAAAAAAAAQEQKDAANAAGSAPRASPDLDKSLAELLAETGYTVVPGEPRHAVEISTAAAETPAARDPTWPQFRPNTAADTADRPSPRQPAEATLRYWKQLTAAEAQASERGGWGRLSFAEFEEIYKSQGDLGNRLDYLGSWIDFCIP